MKIFSAIRSNIPRRARNDRSGKYQNISGGYIDRLKGIPRVDQIVPPGEAHILRIEICTDEDQLGNMTPKWVRDDYPLNATWALTHA